MPASDITIFCPTQSVFSVVFISQPMNSLYTHVKLLLTCEPSDEPALIERKA